MEICQLMEKFDYKYNLNDINNKLFRLHESKIGLIHMYLKKIQLGFNKSKSRRVIVQDIYYIKQRFLKLSPMIFVWIKV